MGETLFPHDFYLPLPPHQSPGRVNWIRRYGDTPYVKAGVTDGEGGGKVWVLLLNADETFTPLWPEWEVTESEEVKVIELLRSLRESESDSLPLQK